MRTTRLFAAGMFGLCLLGSGRSGGVESICYGIPIADAPSEHDVGPFCPRNIAGEAEVSRIWLESGEVYDADGSFIEGVADVYDDLMWQLFDPVPGDVFGTDTQAAREVAAQANLRGYHDHVVSPGESMSIGCFNGEVAGEADEGRGGGEVLSCDDADDGMPCCGDDVCDGPETTDNCAEDCR